VKEVSHDSKTAKLMRADVNWITKPRHVTLYLYTICAISDEVTSSQRFYVWDSLYRPNAHLIYHPEMSMLCKLIASERYRILLTSFIMAVSSRVCYTFVGIICVPCRG